MDVHDEPKPPSEAREQIASGTKEHEADLVGVRQDELFHHAGDRDMALSPPSPRRSHRAASSVCPVATSTRSRDRYERTTSRQFDLSGRISIK